MKKVSAEKKLVDKLGKECTENIEETRLPEITSAKDENKHKCSSCTLYIILFSINFTINVGIGTYFACSHWYVKKRCYSCYVWYPQSNNNLMNL